MVSEIFMPDGKGSTIRAPFVLSVEQAILFLQIDGKNPTKTLSYYRSTGALRGRIMGKAIVYPLEELVEFVRNGALANK